MSIKLFDYQKEVVESDANEIFIDWSRGMGKTFTIANYIIRHRPNKVLYESISTTAIQDNLKEVIDSDNTLNKDLHSHDLYSDKIVLKYKDNTETIIELVNIFTDNSGKNCDLYIVDDVSKTGKIGSDYSKLIVCCSININDASYSLQKESVSENAFISLRDYKHAPSRYYKTDSLIYEAVTCTDSFYREIGILDKNPRRNYSTTHFKMDAMESLKKQFIDTPATKDTVLTRKNLIEMMKDLNEIK